MKWDARCRIRATIQFAMTSYLNVRSIKASSYAVKVNIASAQQFCRGGSSL
jgi:hypothetical protein